MAPSAARTMVQPSPAEDLHPVEIRVNTGDPLSATCRGSPVCGRDLSEVSCASVDRSVRAAISSLTGRLLTSHPPVYRRILGHSDQCDRTPRVFLPQLRAPIQSFIRAAGGTGEAWPIVLYGLLKANVIVDAQKIPSRNFPCFEVIKGSRRIHSTDSQSETPIPSGWTDWTSP